MSRSVNGGGPALRVGLIATAMVLAAHTTAGAAEDCLSAPNRAPGPGGHWYFHVDRQDRKCWYLVEPAPLPRAADALTPPLAPPAAPPLAPPLSRPLAPAAPVAQPPGPPPSLDSIFSFWTTGFTSTPVPPPPGTANAAVPLGRPEDDATARQPRAARRSDGPQAALPPKPRKPAPARAPLAHADDQGAAPLTEADRDALFREFLRWQGRQSPQ
jgi:hypothetical protein